MASLMAAVGSAPSIALVFPFAPFTFALFPGPGGPVPITAMLTATEISRHVVPEPMTGSLVALGLAGLAIGRWHLRRGRKA
jgi:hypothetical protein